MKFTATLILVLLTVLCETLFAQSIFVESQNIEGRFPTSAQLVDLDNDNDLDLVRTNDAAIGLNDLNATNIWLNDGTGDFTLHQSFGNSQGLEVACGDLDGDGDIDLFIVHGRSFGGGAADNGNKVWINDGTGTFTSNGQLLGNRTSLSVALLDIDNDNDLDAFVGNSRNLPNVVWVNNGNGQFSQGQLLGGSITYGVASADFDDDGDMDVITANCCNYTTNTNRENIVWKNNGSGTFINSQEIGNFSSRNVSIADIDGDLDIDVVFSNSYDPSKAYINNGNGNFSFLSDISDYSIESSSNRLADFDNDGDNDLILGVFSSEIENKILINDGQGNFTEDFIFGTQDTREIAIGDIDNDGDNDILESNINFEDSRFWINQQDLGFETENVQSVKIYPNPINANFTLSIDNLYDKIEVSIYNMLNQKIYNTFIEYSSPINIPLKGPDGIYLVKIKVGGKDSIIRKLIKKS